jgi:hypothetical protein
MKKSATKKFDQLVTAHLRTALKKIGTIKPWFDEEVQEWVFEHRLYPESCSGKTKKEVIKLYPLYLRQFIEQRLKNNLAPSIEKATAGRGGKREGAGRPIGTTKAPTRTVRLPENIALWIKSDPAHLKQLQRLVDAS